MWPTCKEKIVPKRKARVEEKTRGREESKSDQAGVAMT